MGQLGRKWELMDA